MAKRKRQSKGRSYWVDKPMQSKTIVLGPDHPDNLAIREMLLGGEPCDDCDTPRGMVDLTPDNLVDVGGKQCVVVNGKCWEFLRAKVGTGKSGGNGPIILTVGIEPVVEVQ